MFSKDQIEKAVFYSSQDPTSLAYMVNDINEFIRSDILVALEQLVTKVNDINEFIRSDKKQLLDFSVTVEGTDVVGAIDEIEKTVAITVPSGTDVTALVTNFEVSNYATLKVGSTNQVSGTTKNNFTNAVTFVVTAKDTTTQEYVATVTVATQ